MGWGNFVKKPPDYRRRYMIRIETNSLWKAGSTPQVFHLYALCMYNRVLSGDIVYFFHKIVRRMVGGGGRVAVVNSQKWKKN